MSKEAKTAAIETAQELYEANLTSLADIYGVEIEWEVIDTTSAEEVASESEDSRWGN